MDDAGTLGLGHGGLDCGLLLYSIKGGCRHSYGVFLVVCYCMSGSV